MAYVFLDCPKRTSELDSCETGRRTVSPVRGNIPSADSAKTALDPIDPPPKNAFRKSVVIS